ncbi:hypothetical protein B0I35DRAFT_264648 [Stachybotrys elegans]|uniref:Zn(2)-C6 fungal-type domain-containing protein n=1 Tax=Stachybotrys elegans TaxID=80388 RepID=A0A8K0SR88_9HYPO|nr:hypothetical protein B0I35DRAFT_264648 [Stachybotrys elegans]
MTMYVSRACDSCRRRKVKCDAAKPCANCHISQIPCDYSHQARRRGPRVSKRAPAVDPQLTRQLPQDGAALRPASNGARAGSLESSSQRGPSVSRMPESDSTLNTDVLIDPGTLVSHQLGYGPIHARLVASVTSVLASTISPPTTATFDVAQHCINLFLQYMFPNTPIAHERTLRDSASLFQHSGSPETALFDHTLKRAKSFTLITALCAFIASVMPDNLLPSGKLLSTPFLQASKAMLRLYEEHDLEHPDSTSITIRIWHSGALQNSTGRPGAAWHRHSEASLLALRLRLYDEEAVVRDSAVESRLLRANFWLLYLADQSAACLENRASIVNEHLFQGAFTLLENKDGDPSLLEESDTTHGLEERIVLGFHLKVRIWAAAAKVITEIKAQVRNNPGPRARIGSEVSNIAELNLRFTTLIHELPPWLRLGDIDTAMDTYQSTCLWTLRSNIITTYHCLRLVILQKCVETDMLQVLGLTKQPLSWALRRLEIVQDFLGELQVVPFLCYKVQGEAGVERIRRVGAILLELVESAESNIVKDRARLQFATLLDFLAKLDSKASDELKTQV